MRVLSAELLPESDLIKQRYVDRFRHDPAEASFIALMEAENGQLVGHFRLVAQRTDQPIQLEDDADCPY